MAGSFATIRLTRTAMAMTTAVMTTLYERSGLPCGYDLSWAIASAPFCVLFTGENSFTFQTAIPSIALMALAFIFSNGARQYSRHAFVIAIGFIGVIGISEILAVCTNSYMLTNKTLIRALMFIVIVWFYATAVSHNYTSYEIKILMQLIGLSVVLLLSSSLKNIWLRECISGACTPLVCEQ